MNAADKLPGYQRPGAASCHDQAQRAIASLREAICELLPCARGDLADRLEDADYGTVDEASIGRAVGDLIRDREIVERDGALELGGGQ